jgi:hypothetical protein
MKDIITRVYKIFRAEILEKISGKKGWYDYETPQEFENANSYSSRGYTGEEKFSGSSRGTPRENDSGIPSQVIQDLSNFGLTPPSSLEEVKKARNREMKKYHSDRFINDPDRYETSKKIMQIYNAAYDRLKVYYESK